VRSSKYDPLRDYLRAQNASDVVLSLEEIEDILGFELNEAASRPNWWANAKSFTGRTQRHAWAEARYDAFYLVDQRAVRFSRIRE
jgi:hypothetical protein